MLDMLNKLHKTLMTIFKTLIINKTFKISNTVLLFEMLQHYDSIFWHCRNIKCIVLNLFVYLYALCKLELSLFTVNFTINRIYFQISNSFLFEYTSASEIENPNHFQFRSFNTITARIRSFQKDFQNHHQLQCWRIQDHINNIDLWKHFGRTKWWPGIVKQKKDRNSVMVFNSMAQQSIRHERFHTKFDVGKYCIEYNQMLYETTPKQKYWKWRHIQNKLELISFIHNHNSFLIIQCQNK